MKRVLLLLACLLSMPVQAGEMYRWMDKHGRMNYGDVPPVGATDVERIKSSGNNGPADDLPYATRIAQQNFPVTLYVSDGCGDTCDQAHSLLSKRGIPYSVKVLKTTQDIEAFRQLSGINRIVPVLAVGKDYLKGFLETQWNTELDIAGYPKNAGFRQRIASPEQAVPPEAVSDKGQPNTDEPTEQ